MGLDYSTAFGALRFQDTSRTVQDGAKTILDSPRLEPRRPNAPPRLSSSQTVQNGPQVDENPSKMRVKSHPHLGVIFWSMFDRFSIDFSIPEILCLISSDIN